MSSFNANINPSSTIATTGTTTSANGVHDANGKWVTHSTTGIGSLPSDYYTRIYDDVNQSSKWYYDPTSASIPKDGKIRANRKVGETLAELINEL